MAKVLYISLYIVLMFILIEKSIEIINFECNTTKLIEIDESGSNLFVIGDRRNRFLTNDVEYQYFCSVQKSWVKDIRDYIRQCMPQFSTQKLMARKLGNQIQVQANKLCDPKLIDLKQLYANTHCLNKVFLQQFLF